MTTIQLPTSWQDRLAIIEAFNINIDKAAELFNVPTREIQVACDLAKQQIIKIKPLSEIDKARWGTTITKVPVSSTPPLHMPAEPIPEAVAKVGIPVELSRGVQPRPSALVHTNKVAVALAGLTTEPVPLESFLTEFSVSKTVLRQSKRFVDIPIKVSIKKDPQTGIEMICRI